MNIYRPELSILHINDEKCRECVENMERKLDSILNSQEQVEEKIVKIKNYLHDLKTQPERKGISASGETFS